MSVKYGKRRPFRTFRSRVQTLRPNAAEAVSLGNEIKDVPIRGPAGLIVPAAVRDGEPLRLGNQPAASHGRDEDPGAAWRNGVEANPAIVLREMRGKAGASEG